MSPPRCYQLAAGTRVPPLLFDVEEVTALVTGLQVLGEDPPHRRDDGGSTGADAAARAMAKLVSVLPPALAARARAAALATEVLEAGSVLISAQLAVELADAVDQLGRVSFGYTDTHGAVSRRVVDPYRHVRGAGVWYLVAYDVDRADWRTFRVDRIRDLRRVPGRFSPKPFPAESVAAWFASDFGRAAPPHPS